MSDIQLYSAKSCPFAQRTRLVLLEKAIAYEEIEIDLDNKPQWFQTVSPYSKVSALKRGGEIVYESAVINEYLDEIFPEPSLMPREPGRRAAARIWIDYCNSTLTTTWYKVLLAQDGENRRKLGEQLQKHFLFMEEAGIGKLGGKYWLGDQVSLVDFTFYPWFERLPVMAHYRKITLPPACRRLAAWAGRMSERPSVKALALPPETLIRNASKYADGTQTGPTADELRDD